MRMAISSPSRSISAAASIGVSVLDTGHPVRLLGAGPAAGAAHLGQRGGDLARAELLDLTVDLTSPVTRAAGDARLREAARAAAEGSVEGEVTVAIIDPTTDDVLEDLAPIGAAGRAWAIVRADPDDPADAQATAARLSRAGWHASVVRAGDDIAGVWRSLVAMEERR